MRINNNISALNAWRGLTSTDNALSKSLEKLSSGLRINKAADDAAGLAISEKMRGQINGLNQASRNAQDSISLIQTAEGALTESHSILQRIRELSVQAANDTNTYADRVEIQKEVNQLVEEINRIGNTTEFNTKKLLNGGAGLQGSVDGTDKVALIGGSDSVKVGSINLDDVVASSTGTMRFESRVTADSSDAAFSAFKAGSFSINGTSIAISAGDTIDSFLAKVNSVTSSTGVVASGTLADGITFTTEMTGTTARIDISGINSVLDVGALNKLQASINGAVLADSTGIESATGSDASATITGAAGGTSQPTGYTSAGNVITFTGGDYDGLQIKVDKSATSDIDAVTVNITANNVLSMHIGANQGQTMGVGINDMRALALGVSNIDVTTKDSAEFAIESVNDAIEQVSSERSKLGAMQNRLEHTIRNLGVAAENLSAAESRIRDVDMAAEMMNFTKQNILMQAGTAMLAQANARPQSVLQLLG